jgi:hypothetical protein
MNTSVIVQKLWNSARLFLLGADRYCNVLPACRTLLGVYMCLAGRQAGRRDDLSTCGAQAGGMSYGLHIEFEPVLTYGITA